MARRHFRSGRSTLSLKTWTGQVSPVFGADTLPAGTGPDFSPGLISLGDPGSEDVTILRTRGEVTVQSAEVLGEGENVQIAVGLGLCTTEAALAGAVPLPFDNPEWDGWFVYMVKGLLHRGFGSTVGGPLEASFEIDSKAMRKVPAGQVVFLATQLFRSVSAVGGEDDFNEIIQLRSLLKTS